MAKNFCNGSRRFAHSVAGCACRRTSEECTSAAGEACRSPVRRALLIEQVVREHVDDNQRTLWREGLRLTDLMSQHYNGKPFVDSSSEERMAVLTVLSDNDHMTDLPEVRFFLELKRLTTEGYYTSKVGIHEELEYQGNRILMEYVGCDDPSPKGS
jgi:hypothetical protein